MPIFFREKKSDKKDELVIRLRKEKINLSKLLSEANDSISEYKATIEKLEKRIEELEEQNSGNEELVRMLLDGTGIAPEERLLSLKNEEGFDIFEYYFLEPDLMKKIERNQMYVRDILEQFEYYEEFRKLYLFKNRIFNKASKILMLLQMVDEQSFNEDEDNVFSGYMGYSGDFLQSISDYNKALVFLSNKARYKKEFRETFSLYTSEDEKYKIEEEE